MLYSSSPSISYLCAEVRLSDEEAQELLTEIQESRKDLETLKKQLETAETQLTDVKNDYNEQKKSYEMQLKEAEKQTERYKTLSAVSASSAVIMFTVTLLLLLL